MYRDVSQTTLLIYCMHHDEFKRIPLSALGDTRSNGLLMASGALTNFGEETVDISIDCMPR